VGLGVMPRGLRVAAARVRRARRERRRRDEWQRSPRHGPPDMLTPTAPSPTTATVMPGFTLAASATNQPVPITSDNRVFKSYDDIVDHCCYAWNTLVDQPWQIMSIARRDWATIGQSL
jgi:hypothetical protein